VFLKASLYVPLSAYFALGKGHIMKSPALFTAAKVELIVSYASGLRAGNEVWCYTRGINITV
jgi:hypothetical protein